MSRLARIVPACHSMLAEVLGPGDTAIDLTAGNGHDTLFLSRCVGPEGLVVAFDLQPQSLDSTGARLAAAGISFSRHDGAPLPIRSPGVHLVRASHDRLHDYFDGPVKAAIANLGYLPGGDKSIVTRPEETLQALRQVSRLLTPGGRLAVVAYTGHPGGSSEAAAVRSWFRLLDAAGWDVLERALLNRPAAPILLVAEKL